MSWKDILKSNILKSNMLESLRDKVDGVIWNWIFTITDIDDWPPSTKDKDIITSHIIGDWELPDILIDQFYNWYLKKYPEGELKGDFIEDVPSDNELESEFVKEIYTPKFIKKQYDMIASQGAADARTQAAEMGYSNYVDGTWYGD